MSGVKASVVITYFDETEFIDAAVASALDQSFDAAYEVILIDDGGERHLRILVQIACRRFVAFQINADRGTCRSRSGQAQDGAGAAGKVNAQTLVLR